MVNPSVPDGWRLYAVGDIHGRADLLRNLHARIAADSERPDPETGATGPNMRIIYLGDYIDRGDHSRQVVETLVADRLPGFDRVCIGGNHEQYLLEFLEDPEVFSAWLFNGGDATLRSYGVEIEDPAFGREGEEWLQRQFREALPDEHLMFYRDLVSGHSAGDYFFCHAGVRPGIAIDQQVIRDLTWIRDEFLHAATDFGKIVVHGHSVTDDVDFRANRIGVDTGAYRSGRLSCLVLEGASRRVIQT